jgi:hypothetical protein
LSHVIVVNVEHHMLLSSRSAEICGSREAILLAIAH